MKTSVPSSQNSKPSEMNKTLLLIATATPALAIMYLQEVNIWVILVLLSIIVSQAFNLSTVSMQNQTSNILTNKSSDIIDTLNSNSKGLQDLYTNQITLRNEFNNLNTGHKVSLQTFKQINECLQTLETQIQVINKEIEKLNPANNCVPPASG